jgi:hypothetical protein
MYSQLETRTLQSPMEGVLLRYGFFYGPNTWYHPDGGASDQVRQQQFPTRWQHVSQRKAIRPPYFPISLRTIGLRSPCSKYHLNPIARLRPSSGPCRF